MSDPKTRRERALDVLCTIGGSPEGGRFLADFFDGQGALGSFVLHTGVGEIWARPGFSRRDRSLVVVSILTALARPMELRQHVSAGLNHGLERDEIDEIMVQIGVYAGAPVALAGAGVVAAVFAERDGTQQRETPAPPAEQKPDAERRVAGLDVIRTLVGQPDLDAAATEAAILEGQGDLGVLVMDYAFGDVWSRPQLSRRDRSLVVISVLTALNMTHELEIHLGGALNHGVTRAEIEEMLITMVLYGGFPRAIDGQRLAHKVFAARDAATS